MDKIEEWMGRTMDSKDSSNKSSNPGGERRKPFYHKGHSQKPSSKPPQNTAKQQPAKHHGAQKHKKHHGGGHHHAPAKHNSAPRQAASQRKQYPILKGKLKMIPLGGLDEVGKNMMAIEYENDIIILDMGLEFPSEDMLGIDYVIPDTTYLEDNKKRIRGVVITHGHLDHIGGIPYILPKLDFPPVYGTKLTLGLIQKRGEEFKQEKLAQLRVIDPDKPLRLGCFTCNFIRVTHSIPDCVAVVIDTPIGRIMDTGDFKFDNDPIQESNRADIHKLERLANQNILALFCESTNSLKPGHSMSEKEVGITLEKIVRETGNRIIVASFASQIGRMQMIIDAAAKNNRKIFVSGRSMVTNIDIAARLGYLKIPKDLIKDIKQYKKVPDHQTLILTTGSQGESVSALTRMADNEHAHVKVRKGDTIILSSSPIIGNERAISTVVNKLTMLGADVIHNKLMDVHTSGHGNRDELARMIRYAKPKYLIPIHGEFFMRKALGDLARQDCGIPEDRIIMLQNGDVLVGERDKVYKSNEKVETKYILIDGSGEGQVGAQVLVDREIMSQNGAIIVLIYINRKTKKLSRDPDVISRGFIYMHESERITAEIIKISGEAYRRIVEKNSGANRKDIKKYIRQTVDKFTTNELERRPLIIPLIIEV